MNKRVLLGLGSVAAVLAIGGAALLSGIGMTQRSEVLYMTDGPDYKDVTDLTKASAAVAHVRRGDGQSRKLVGAEAAVESGRSVCSIA